MHIIVNISKHNEADPTTLSDGYNLHPSNAVRVRAYSAGGQAGRSLTLTYRSKPLARIVPLREEQALAEDDPIFRLDELAEPIGPLTNTEIDALVDVQ